jgi:hypothetical protein
MLRLKAEVGILEPHGRGAPEAPLGECNRRGLAAACVSQSRSSGSIGSLALFRSRPSRYSTHEQRQLSRLSGECRLERSFHVGEGGVEPVIGDPDALSAGIVASLNGFAQRGYIEQVTDAVDRRQATQSSVRPMPVPVMLPLP